MIDARCRLWGLGGSLAWGVAAILAWLGAQVALSELLVPYFEDGVGELRQLAENGPFVALITIGTAVVPLAVIALAVRRAHCRLSDYLGLDLPARRYVTIGLLSLAILVPAVDLVSWLAGHAVTPQFVLDLYRSARDEGGLLLLAIALVVAAPLVEEIVFRGFLLPGLAASAIGASGAIVLTAAAWTLLHGQYQPFYLIQIMVLGVLFGWLRLRSGSTILTMALHGLLNLTAIAQAAVIVEWLS